MKSKRTVVLAVTIATVIAVLLAISLYPGSRQHRLLRPSDAQLVARGQQVYVAQCAACHGQRLEGQPNWRERSADGLLPAPPHDAGGHTWHHPDDLLFRMVKLGVAKAANLKDYESTMPAFEDRLSDEDIIAVLSWINAQWPAEIRDRVEKMNAQMPR